MLSPGSGTDIIVDFELGTDRIGLADGLRLDDLTFTGSEIATAAETLAVLASIDTTTLVEEDFVIL